MFCLLGGYEVKTIGDSFFVAFPDPTNAVRFAMQLQIDMMTAPWPDSLLGLPDGLLEVSPSGSSLWCGLRVRVGIHLGEAKVEIDRDTLKVCSSACSGCAYVPAVPTSRGGLFSIVKRGNFFLKGGLKMKYRKFYFLAQQGL